MSSLPHPAPGLLVAVLTVELVACRKGDDASPGLRGGAGPSAVFRVGDHVDICVISRHLEPNNLACMRDLDIDATKRKYLVLKSRVHWQNSRGFGYISLLPQIIFCSMFFFQVNKVSYDRPIYKGVVECDGTGVCGSDYDLEEHVNVRRPIYPLELEAPPLSEEEALAQSLTVDAGAEE